MYVILLSIMIAQGPSATITMEGGFTDYFECMYHASGFADFVNQQNNDYRVVSYQCRRQ